ncbi:unnamed protein product [Gulo gulo]|uniref:Uncharacterized protein n=1 Tax=Gulo gulo TaxID=48420 RepID=A0A9X9LV45_GULGU|nr:unnamed protein product [Gulo gulo]
MNNRKGDAKILHSALQTGVNSHQQLQEVGHGIGRCSGGVGHAGISPCAGSGHPALISTFLTLGG